MRRVLVAAIAAALAVAGGASSSAYAGAPATTAAHTLTTSTAPAHDSSTLRDYASTTWASFVAMVDPSSGLPTDQLHADGSRDTQTSTTDIGAYLWSAVAAERIGLVSHTELVSRLDRTLTTLERMERHAPDGQYYNWYDYRTGAKLTTWPDTGAPLDPILSSVDNGWLAAGLRVVANSVPELAARAGALYDSMDFSLYYVPDRNRILFYYSPAQRGGPCCYDTLVSESRIADYIGIAKGEFPRKLYYGRWRSFPDTCDWSWQETRPAGFHRTYDGVDVYDGSYAYGDTRLTPSWGGSMFEDLMPALLVPEEKWAPGSWRLNHPLTVDAQIDHGLNVAGYGIWGFSPSDTPEGGYDAYGVDAIGMDPSGYASNEDDTLVDHGFAGCAGREPQPDPPPSAYTNGVVTPHAAFLALRYRPQAAMTDLARLAAIPGMYGRWGFADSVNARTLHPAAAYLSLDQGIVMAALGNALGADALRAAFATPDMRAALRPAMGVEEFNDTPRGCTISGTDGADTLVGTPGDDVICGLGGDDVIDGAGGDDVVYGDAGDDRISGGTGDDTLYGGAGDDRIAGGDGADVVSAGPGDDRLSGDAGADHLEGGAGVNRCAGDAADDAPGDC